MSVGARVFAVERAFVAVASLVMGLAVFLDVVHRVATRDYGLGARGAFAAASWVFIYAALCARGRPGGLRTGLLALAVEFGLWLALWVFVRLVPNGLVWSQTLGLVLMLWISCVGASMATYQHRHLALDLGSKLWPRRVLHYVQAAGNAVTAAFCLALGLLAVTSVRSHFADWQEGGGQFVALALPKWIAFLAIPITLTLMAARFAAQARASWLGHVEEDDTMAMLGLKATTTAGESAGDSGARS